MSRMFSIPTVLRMVPNDLLARFLKRLGHSDIAKSCSGLGERDIEPIVRALSELPTLEFDRVERELHSVFDLACETGIEALREAGGLTGNGKFPANLPEDVGFHHLSMWAWLKHPAVLRQAIRIHQVDHLAWWRKRSDLPRVEPDNSKRTLRRLAGRLSTLLICAQGRGKVCTVESMPRRGTEYFFAHPDDFIQTVSSHNAKKRLRPCTFRQTFTIAFAYNANEGTLEMFARLPARLKRDIEAAFLETVIGVEANGAETRVAYNLNHLKARGFDLVTNPTDCVRVDVQQLRLKPKNSNRQITLKADPSRERDIFVMLHEVLDKDRLPLSSLEVKAVTFRFQFQQLGDRKEGSMTFQVSYPDTCNLRNYPQEWIELAHKYLRLWRIDAT